jgi:hypothetical protein
MSLVSDLDQSAKNKDPLFPVEKERSFSLDESSTFSAEEIPMNENAGKV